MGDFGKTAQLRWELENNVEHVSSSDAYFQYNAAEQQAIQNLKPWKQDPGYYKKWVQCAYCFN